MKMQRHRPNLAVLLPAIAAAMMILATSSPLVLAQVPAEPEVPLYQREPLDQITLDEANGGGSFQVRPSAFADRRVPADPNPESSLQVEVRHSGKFEKAQIPWRNIAKVELFEQRVLAEAEALVAAQKFEQAYDYFAFLHESYPQLAGLAEASQNYLYRNAGRLFQQKKFVEALAVLDELHRQNPQHAGAATALGAVTEQLLRGYVERRQFAAARKLLEATIKRGPGLAIVQSWQKKLQGAADARLQTARNHFAAGEFRQARDGVEEALEIWPAVEGGSALLVEVLRRYPMGRVGVGQTEWLPWGPPELQRTVRRTAPLIQRPLVELTGYRADGAVYSSPQGEVALADDRRSLEFRLQATDPAGAHGIVQTPTGYDLSQRLLAWSDVADRSYRRDVAALVQGVAVEDVFQVRVEFRRPHLSPLAILASASVSDAATGDVPVQDKSPLSPWAGDFLRQSGESGHVHYVRVPGSQPQGVREIVELPIADPLTALGDLRRGRLDIVERVPADALKSLASEKDLRAAPYAVPSIHVLAPNYRQPLAASATLRRALAYALPRDVMLANDLLGGAQVPGCRVISGPFPAGKPADDPWAYAYDDTIAPLPCEPRLAVTLREVAQQEMAQGKLHDRASATEEIVLGHGPDWLHRRACAAIVKQWARCGIASSAVELAPNRPELAQECHFYYVELVVCEPAIDVPRMFAAGGLAPPGEHLALALRDLQAATNMQEARKRLHQIHAIVHAELPVIPLWQLTDYYAHRAVLSEVAAKPISLYQGIGAWRFTVASAPAQAPGGQPSSK
jgi:tetratricopeptide (TPR) repeat protein